MQTKKEYVYFFIVNVNDIQLVQLYVKSTCNMSPSSSVLSGSLLMRRFLMSLRFYFGTPNFLFLAPANFLLHVLRVLFVFTPVHKSHNFCITIYRPAATLQLVYLTVCVDDGEGSNYSRSFYQFFFPRQRHSYLLG